MSSGEWQDVSVTEAYKIGWTDRWMDQWTLLRGDWKAVTQKDFCSISMLRILQFHLVESRELLKNFVQGSDWKRFPSHSEMTGSGGRMVWPGGSGYRQGEVVLVVVFPGRKGWLWVEVVEGRDGDVGRSWTGKSTGLVRLLALIRVSAFW